MGQQPKSTQTEFRIVNNYAKSPAVELCVIVPTFNERANVQEVVNRLDSCLEQISWEVIFVDDDSPDGTATIVRTLGAKDSRVRCLQRLDRRGLSSACIEGMLATTAPFLAVMDADLQHDETLLVPMIEVLKKGEADIVVGSRYVDGGGIGQWDHRRADCSRFATRLSKLVLNTDLNDPMSGFFMMHRRSFEAAMRQLSGVGFKILLDLLASSKQALRVKELPYQFRMRYTGQSKLDSAAAWDYLMLLMDKRLAHIVPVRFIAFALVGGCGVFVHLLVLLLTFKGFELGFTPSQSIATVAAMTSNFTLNNMLTYRDMRLTGWRWLRGLIGFIIVCSVGAFANVGSAAYLFSIENYWLLSAVAGIVVGAVWNYAVSSVFTWNVLNRQKNSQDFAPRPPKVQRI
jgi:dolichol-phosphate mannosyltransferase